MKKITLIFVYFGNWPSWFPVFLKTCTYNHCIDFLIFTDCEIPLIVNYNIRFENFNLSKFNELASQKLNMQINVTDPYKLCDFKPAYGKIFKEYLTQTDFWGYSDLDIIFGDIRNFITDEILLTYDIITAKQEYLVGHFTLYRNCIKVNNLYKKSKSYKLVFQSDFSCCFDECSFLWWDLLSGRSISELSSPIDSMTHVALRLQDKGILKVLFRNLMLEQDNIDEFGNLEEWSENLFWNRGKLINTNKEEYMYFHFHFLKKKQKFSSMLWFKSEIPDQFYVGKDGFYK